jgi:hypothetical protein
MSSPVILSLTLPGDPQVESYVPGKANVTSSTPLCYGVALDDLSRSSTWGAATSFSIYWKNLSAGQGC